MDFRINTCDVRSTKDRECESERIGWVLGRRTTRKRCCGRRPGRCGMAKTFRNSAHVYVREFKVDLCMRTHAELSLVVYHY